MRHLNRLQTLVNLRVSRRHLLLPQILKLKPDNLTMNLVLIMHPLHGLLNLPGITTAPTPQLSVVACMRDGAKVIGSILRAEVVRWRVEAYGLFLAKV